MRFDKHTTIVNDISMANEVLLDRDASFAIRHNFLQQTIPDAELDGWQAARKLVNPRMRRTLTNAHMRTVAAVTGEHLAGLSDLHGDKPFDAMTAMEHIASHSIARFYFGKDSAGIPEAVGALLDALSVLIGNPFALPSSIRTPARRRVEHELACLRRILDPLIVNRAGLNRPGTDFVSSLFRGQTPTDRPPVERVTNIVIGSLLAGQRVPAAAACWAVLHATGDSTTWSHLRDEGKKFHTNLSAGGVAPGDYEYASAVVAESLRLNPPTWLISRTATKSVRLGTYTFAEGHNFLISPYILHRDQNAFEAPDEFRPARWSKPPSALGRRAFLPYGAGPRACPGSNLADATLAATLLTVASTWDVSTHGSVVADPRTTLTPAGLRLSLRPLQRSVTPRSGDGLRKPVLARSGPVSRTC